ncbi:F-box/LRR-repeat protein [Apostasia shenzhenica]|uniref:F-box/LRR-repeat protein n=1 Tax=Apostasia shenzhenica TaxID=1088818 RepID=A0A2I0ANQ1_9ASPA|nr:F-box/LRR-repeat protein [Apostasia shenzhenica]
MSENAKRQKLASIDEGGEIAVDRISDLPDSLLLYILSFIEAHELVKTSLLSKRWKSLWASVTTLNFRAGSWNNPPYFVTYINSYLMLHEGQKVHRFRARFDSRGVQHVCIDSWFNFLKRRDVEELDLYFSNGCLKRHTIELEKYVICKSLFDCKVLKTMRLTGCDIDPAAFFHFKLLKELVLDNVNFSNLDLSGCPLLESLTLRHCNDRGTVDIHAPSTKLRSLKLADYSYQNSKLVLCAPHVSFITFCEGLRREYHMKNVSALTMASMDLRLFTSEMDYLIGLIGTIGHAQTFSLSCLCFEGLASAIMDNHDIPSVNVVALEVKTDLSRLDIWMLMHVLRIFPCVEFLVFNICKKWYAPELSYTFSRTRLKWRSLEKRFVSAANVIKKVKITDFLTNNVSRNDSCGDPLSNTIEFSRLASDEDLKPVKLLLRSCSMLREMDIKITNTKYIRRSSLKSNFLIYLCNKIQDLPKTSKNVQISIS